MEDPYFAQMLQAVRASPGFPLVLSRHRIRNDLLRKHKQMKQQLVSYLRGQCAPVSLVLDGWTNVNHAKVTNILLVSPGKAYNSAAASSNHPPHRHSTRIPNTRSCALDHCAEHAEQQLQQRLPWIKRIVFQ